MAIYKIFSEADTTIYSKFPAMNTGLDEILEVSVKNSEDANNSLIAGVGPISSDDLRRSLIKFSSDDLQKLKAYATGSFKVYLKLYLANAENLNTDYYLEIRQVAQDWEMGTGHFADSPQTKNGACWYTSQSYYTNVTNWLNPQYYLTPGGGSWNNTFTTQSFDYNSDKDINVDVTAIVDEWFSGSQSNYGFLVKHPNAVENNSGSYIALNFYSNDTHTIYPPTLEIRWDDSVYTTGSLSVLSDSDSVITLSNNMGYYKKNTDIYKFRVNSRDKYPTRVFTTSSLYTSNKRLPQQSYWSLVDAKTNETVVDFDTNYTKISCDGVSSYFNVHMNGLEPERYYKLLIKCNLPSGEQVDYDNNLIFKVTN
jgi:hypothetical protein